MHVKTGDEVLIITGKDKGKRGKIKQALPKDSRVVVEGLNMIKRHMKQRGPGKPSGIIEHGSAASGLECDADLPTVRPGGAHWSSLSGGNRSQRPARKVRFCKACDEAVDE